ncbi:MAG: hypothetical protein ACLR8P_10905 [Clostridium fessum]
MVQQQHLARHSAHLDGKMQQDLAITECNRRYFNRYFGGIILIKVEQKKLYQVCKRFQPASNDMRTGLIEEGKRPVLGEETVSPDGN